MNTEHLVSLLQDLQKRIVDASVVQALALARVYGNIAWNNHIGVYRADNIEEIVYGKLEAVKQAVLGTNVAKNGKVIHVLTEGYDSGGHTRVVERLLACQSKITQDVAIVEICKREIRDRFSITAGRVLCMQSTGVGAVEELAAVLAKYSYVVLHIHPDDIATSMAARIARESGTRIALYNHADHCFTFGLPSTDVLCEISVYGSTITKNYRNDIEQTFAGIPLTVGQLREDHVREDFLLSSGPAYKFDFRQGGAFATILESLIPSVISRGVIIGPGHLPSDASSRVQQLQREGRILVLPPAEHAVYKQYLKTCSLYVDSAPVTGGSALPEAALSDVPIAGMVNPIMGYSPVDLARSRTPADLKKRVACLINDGWEDNAFDRIQLDHVHGPENVLSRILAALEQKEFVCIPYKLDEPLDTDYFRRRWSAAGRLIIHNRAFDYVSLWNRIVLCLTFTRLGAFRSGAFVDFAKVFLSNFQTRRLRNR